jgi:hypothetical protein
MAGMEGQMGGKTGRQKPGNSGRSPAQLLDEAIDLLLDLMQDGKQRLEQAGSTTEWVKLAGALGQIETRLAQLLGVQSKFSGGKSDFEQALLQAIREWQERKDPVVASGKTAEQLEADRLARLTREGQG